MRNLWGQKSEAEFCFVGEAIIWVAKYPVNKYYLKKNHRKSSNCNINQLMMQLSIFPCSCKTNQTCNTIEVTSAQNINKCTHPRCLPFLFMKLTQGSTGIWKSVLAKVFFSERKVQETINKGDKKWFPKFILWSCGFNPKGRLLHEV